MNPEHSIAADSLIADLESLVGPAGVVVGTDAQTLIADQYRKLHSGQAVCVVRPKNAHQVARVVEMCSARGLAVVPHGGNTGLSAGQVPITPGPAVVVSLARMNSVQVDPAGWTLTAEAGATIESIQTAAAAHGMAFAPDWGARGSATIGGGIATDAGGNNVLRYGNMRDQVLGLEVVLPDGRIWDGLRALRKDSSGYDLKQLFIGAEGTLGVVTRAVVKLVPATPYEQSALAGLVDLESVMEFFRLARQTAPDSLTAFELVPELGISRVCTRLGMARPLEPGPEFLVLFKLADAVAVTDKIGEILTQATQAGLLTDAVVAATPDHEKQLWTIRDEMASILTFPDTQAHGIKGDSSLPIGRVVEYIKGVRSITSHVAPEALVYCFGHVGDGNIHMMVLPVDPSDIETFLGHRDELVSRIDEMTFKLGGSLSAEHGLGRVLDERARPQKPELEWELMAAIKATLDPANLMNPGAVLPT